MANQSKFQPPTMQGALLRLLFTGLSKAGKSLGSYTLAQAVAAGQKFAVIDTEDKARLYAGQFNFDVLVLHGYTPDAYIAALDEAERAGYPVVVIDGLSDAWTAVKRISAGQRNTQRGWGEATPLQEDLQLAIRDAKMHVIATARALEQVEGNKTRLVPIQRSTMLYEFAELAEIDEQHMITFRNTYVPELRGKRFDHASKVVPFLSAYYKLNQERKQAFVKRMIDRYGQFGFVDGHGVKRLLEMAGVEYDAEREDSIEVDIAQAVADFVEQQKRDAA